jgi:hypothetical protein
MEVHFVGAIEQLTHRSVRAFLSASRQNLDITVELFVLEEEAQPA